MKKFMVADLVKDLRSDTILWLIDEFSLSEKDASYLYDNYQKSDYEWVVKVAQKLNIPINKVIEDDGINHISYLVQQVQAELIELDDAQEDAWAHYGYPEGGQKTDSSSSWAGLWAGGSITEWVVDYEPMFESLGDTLDDDPIYTVTKISIKTNNDEYPHEWSSSDSQEHSLESIEYLEANSCGKWFNKFCGDHRFGSNNPPL